jgi:hypothetical protein
MPGSKKENVYQLYDLSGKLMWHFSIPYQYDRGDLKWDGHTRNGQAAGAGRYIVVWKRKDVQNAPLFILGRK